MSGNEKDKQSDADKIREILQTEIDKGKNAKDSLQKIIEKYDLQDSEIITALADEFLNENERNEIIRESNKAYISKLDGYLSRKKDQNRNKGYKCKVFQQNNNKQKEIRPLTIPAGTLSYIGAMTHRGKTTALISIAIDAILQGQKVVYITTEESDEQIFDRMIKALLFTEQKNNKAIFDEFLGKYTLKNEIDELGSRLNVFMETYEPQQQLMQTTPKNLQQAIYSAFESLQNYVEQGLFAIIDHIAQKNFESLLRLAETLDKNSVVLLDYIQHCKTPTENGINTRQVIIQNESQMLADLAIHRNFVIIAGGQFGRKGNDTEKESDKFRPDFLSPTLFRECGDIEQDAHLIIGIGQQSIESDGNGETPPRRFYEILKQRAHAQDTSKYAIDDNSLFSLFSCKTITDSNSNNPKLAYFEPFEPPKQSKKENDKATGGKKSIDEKPKFNSRIVKTQNGAV